MINSQNKKFLIYDSECLLCQNFLIALDSFFTNKNLTIYITSKPEHLIDFSENKIFNKFLKKNLNYLKEISTQSIIYLEENKIYFKYQAIIKILQDSNHLVLKTFATILQILIPRFLGDFIYKFIAKNRIKISRKLFRKKCNISFKYLKIF